MLCGQGLRRAVSCVDGLVGKAVWSTSRGRHTVFSHPALQQRVTYWRHSTGPLVNTQTHMFFFFGEGVGSRASVLAATAEEKHSQLRSHSLFLSFSQTVHVVGLC